MKRRAPPVPNAPRRRSIPPPFPEVEPKTVKRAPTSKPSEAQTLMALVADIERALPDLESRERLRETLPALAVLLVGSKPEVARRFVSVVRALAPAIEAKTSAREKRAVEVLGAFLQLSTDDMELVGGLAVRLSKSG